MTAPVFKPLFMRWIKFEVTDSATPPVVHNFECEITQAGLTSTGGDTVALTTLCPSGSYSETAERSWQLVVTAAQDVENAESLMMFLLTHEGETATFEYYPKTDNAGVPVGHGFKGTVTLAPPDQIGNVASGTWATFQATLGLQGKYQIVDAAGLPITTLSAPLESDVLAAA